MGGARAHGRAGPLHASGRLGQKAILMSQHRITFQALSVASLHNTLTGLLADGQGHVPVVATDCRGMYPFQVQARLHHLGELEAVLLSVRPDARFEVHGSGALAQRLAAWNAQADDVVASCGAFAEAPRALVQAPRSAAGGAGFGPGGAQVASTPSAAQQAAVSPLSAEIQEKVAHAGELLIRAAAVLGTLSIAQQDQLLSASQGGLEVGVSQALATAAQLSAQIRRSLQTHPPRGFSLAADTFDRHPSTAGQQAS